MHFGLCKVCKKNVNFLEQPCKANLNLLVMMDHQACVKTLKLPSICYHSSETLRRNPHLPNFWHLGVPVRRSVVFNLTSVHVATEVLPKGKPELI